MAIKKSVLILENKGSFENKRSCDMDGFGVYGKTVKRRLYETDNKERYFHIYHSIAKEALHIYKSRDFSEKAFRGDKTYLGDKSLRVHSTESTAAKIFVEFVAMIIRNKLYTCLLDEMKSLEKKLNFMTVPAAIKELEKLEMTRQTDNV